MNITLRGLQEINQGKTRLNVWIQNLKIISHVGFVKDKNLADLEVIFGHTKRSDKLRFDFVFLNFKSIIIQLFS